MKTLILILTALLIQGCNHYAEQADEILYLTFTDETVPDTDTLTLRHTNSNEYIYVSETDTVVMTFDTVATAKSPKPKSRITIVYFSEPDPIQGGSTQKMQTGK